MAAVTRRDRQWMYLSRASEISSAAEIDVSFLPKVNNSKPLENRKSVVIRIIVVPLVPLGMEEEHVGS